MARASTVSRIRLKAAADVSRVRSELIALQSRNLKPEVVVREERRITAEIRGTYDMARQAIGKEVAAAEEDAVSHRAPARRLVGAFGDPARSFYLAQVAATAPPDDLLRLARKAIEADDAAAAHGVFAACVSRGADDVALRPVFEVLSKPTGEEARYLADVLLCRTESAMLDSEETQALSARERVDKDLRRRALEAWAVDFGPNDSVQFNESDVTRARADLGCPWSPSAFELAPEPPKDR